MKTTASNRNRHPVLLLLSFSSLMEISFTVIHLSCATLWTILCFYTHAQRIRPISCELCDQNVWGSFTFAALVFMVEYQTCECRLRLFTPLRHKGRVLRASSVTTNRKWLQLKTHLYMWKAKPVAVTRLSVVPAVSQRWPSWPLVAPYHTTWCHSGWSPFSGQDWFKAGCSRLFVRSQLLRGSAVLTHSDYSNCLIVACDLTSHVHHSRAPFCPHRVRTVQSGPLSFKVKQNGDHCL